MTAPDLPPYGGGGHDPLADLPAFERDRVDGVQLEALELLHAAVLGDHQHARRIVARAIDPHLLAFTVAQMSGRVLRATESPAAHLADLADAIEETP